MFTPRLSVRTDANSHAGGAESPSVIFRQWFNLNVRVAVIVDQKRGVDPIWICFGILLGGSCVSVLVPVSQLFLNDVHKSYLRSRVHSRRHGGVDHVSGSVVL